MAAAANPIEQFEIHEYFPVIKIAGHQIAFTNSAIYMLLAVALTAALMLGSTGGRRLVPTRMQSVAELSYEFIADMIRSAAGEHGLKFFPLVFFTVIIHGFWQHGLHFLKPFAPSGIPIYILPMIVVIEIMSFLARPISHSVRLFANILAGHITLKLVAGFVTMIGAFGFAGWLGATLPLVFTVALYALELLVAFLQAYVFAILTCIYLNDSLHPSH